MNFKPEARLFIAGTMRTGGSLITNMLSVHPKILILGERVHFYRFIHKHYEPLNEDSVWRMLCHQELRLRYRYEMATDVNAIFEAIRKRGFSYDVIYDEMMKQYLPTPEKTIWGEYEALHWHGMPNFLKLYPDSGRAIHMVRDPRAVMSSWKKRTGLPGKQYLNTLFNWLNSVTSMEYFKDILPDDRYTVVQFEHVHAEPEAAARSLCDFIGIDFDWSMVDGDNWSSKFDNVTVSLPTSAHQKGAISGFDMERTRNWCKNLEEWELCLAQMLLGDKMEKLGYESVKLEFPFSAMRRALDAVRSEPFILKQFNHFMNTGNGLDRYPSDPIDPRNWGIRSAIGTMFVDHEIGQEYLRERATLDKKLDKKFGAADRVFPGAPLE